jgi:hypothetical protein
MLEGKQSYILFYNILFNFTKHNKDEDMKEEIAGTTAVCVLIRDKKIYTVCKYLYIYIYI